MQSLPGLKQKRGAAILACAAALAAGPAQAQRPPPVAQIDPYAETAAPRTVPVPPWQGLELGSKGHRYTFPVYANHDLRGEDLRRIRRVVVVMHGLQRNAEQYYSAVAGLLDGNPARRADTLVIAPRFPSTIDSAFRHMPAWRKASWEDGGDSVRAAGRPGAIPAFQVLDDLLQSLDDPARLPALSVIVLAGHSAGAQLVQRYAVLNGIDGRLGRDGLHLRYVVANPSSYLYPTAERPRASGKGYGLYERGVCPTYNQYKYGMDRLPGYAREQDRTRLFVRYAARDVTYLLGEADNNPEQHALDKTCGAEAQGATRLARGLRYVRYESVLAARGPRPVALSRQAYVVTGVGHDETAMLGSTCAARALLGDDARAAPGAAPCTPVPAQP